VENLLAIPVQPIEFVLAKMVPYVLVSYVQVVLILIVSTLFFQLPVRSSMPLLLVTLGLFIAGNLALGITFSTTSSNQMQAIQLVRPVYAPAIRIPVGFHVPVQGHACLGARGWRNIFHDPCDKDRTRFSLVERDRCKPWEGSNLVVELVGRVNGR
jgi:hypothetical protein